MHNRQLPRHRQHRTFTRRIRQLRRRAPHQRHHTRRINHAPPALPKPAHTHHRMLTPKPHPLHVDIVSQIPDFLGGVDGVGVGGVHDACVVEHYVHAAPGVEVGARGGDGGFGGDVAGDGFDAAAGVVVVGDEFLDFFEGDVGHEDGGAFAGEEDGCFETDSAGDGREVVSMGILNDVEFSSTL